MTSENSVRAAQAGTGEEPRPAETTRPIPPVPQPPDHTGTLGADGSDGAARHSANGSNGVPAGARTATTVAEVPAPPATPSSDKDEAGPNESSTVADTTANVKAGAVKAAAAALAVARNAAKRVQAVLPDTSSVSEAAGQAATGAAASAGGAGAARTATTPRPEMHYSAGGVRVTVAQPGQGAPTAAPAAGPAARSEGPRRVRLSVSRIDPWSIMKLAFLLAVAIGIMTVVATIVVWYVLDTLGVFATVEEFIQGTVGPQPVDITQFVEFDRMVSVATLVAVVNVVLLTAIATIMAILYNITAALVGGVHLTLTDD
jgi:Transmembrane domain of unknown function (DUF3566)